MLFDVVFARAQYESSPQCSSIHALHCVHFEFIIGVVKFTMSLAEQSWQDFTLSVNVHAEFWDILQVQRSGKLAASLQLLP